MLVNIFFAIVAATSAASKKASFPESENRVAGTSQSRMRMGQDNTIKQYNWNVVTASNGLAWYFAMQNEYIEGCIFGWL